MLYYPPPCYLDLTRTPPCNLLQFHPNPSCLGYICPSLSLLLDDELLLLLTAAEAVVDVDVVSTKYRVIRSESRHRKRWQRVTHATASSDATALAVRGMLGFMIFIFFPLFLFLLRKSKKLKNVKMIISISFVFLCFFSSIIQLKRHCRVSFVIVCCVYRWEDGQEMYHTMSFEIDRCLHRDFFLSPPHLQIG